MAATHAIWAAVLIVSEACAALFVGWRVSGWSVRDGGSSALRLVVALLVWWSQIVGVQLVCGALFILYPLVVLAMHATIALIVWRRVRQPDAWAGERPTGLEIGALTGVLTFALVLDVRQSLKIPKDIDDLQYHMANSAQWVQSHNIWHIPAADPGYFTNGYPSNGELVTSWVMAPLSGAEWSSLPTILFAALILAAGALLAEELGGRARYGLLGSAAVILSPIMASQFQHASSDWTSIGGLVAAVALIFHGRRSEHRRWYVLAGLALGLAIGSKDTAVGPGLTLMVLAPLLRPRGKRIVSLAHLSAGVLLLGAFWYVRDWIRLGDPIYPETVRLAGHTIFSGGRGPLTDFSTSLMSDLLHGNGPALVSWLEFAGAWIGLAAFPLLGLLVAGRGESFRLERLVVAALAVVWFLLYTAEPYTGPPRSLLFVLAQIRYGVAAIALGVVCGCVSARWARIPAWAALAVDAVYFVRAPVTVHQYGPFPPAPFDGKVFALAVILAALAGGLALVPPGSIARIQNGRLARDVSIVAAPVLAIGALAVLATRHVPASTPLDRLLNAAGRSHGLVMIDSDINLLAAMGPELTHPLVAAAGGDRGEQLPLLTVGQLDARLAQTRPDAVLEGVANPGFGISWTPPGYRLLSAAHGLRVYVKTSIVDKG